MEDQIFDREAERINSRIVRVGSQYFAAMDMNVGPQETLPFSFLLQRMIDLDEFPWRVSFLIEGEGLKTMNVKSFLAAIFSVTNGDNRQIREAIKALQESRTQGTTVTRLRVSFATWAPVADDGMRLIEERASRLQRAVESWGYCGVTPLVGDPLAGVMSSALSLDVASTAPAGAVPLPEVVTMLPWNRDASPWKFGSVVFRTPDGRPWPYQPGSSLQDTFIDLIFAPPGKGKSVYMNTTNLALCLSPASTSGTGGAQLPRIAIIDIGPSSSGLISLLQEALPKDRKGEAAYYRMKMSPEYAINPFDTQLGCRRPMPLDRAFLVNFLTILGTDVGETHPPAGLSAIVGAAIDALYEKFDDRSKKGSPARYNPGVSATIDAAIKEHNLEIKPGFTCWWELVDRLFERNDINRAIVAQRHAVPRLENLMTILRDDQVMAVHGKAKIATGEFVVDVCARMVSSAIREYPILQRPTAFDPGDARVVALDLDEVAPKGGGPADKQTALMYMLARFVLARDFYLNPEIVEFIPQDYRSYHIPRIRRMRETPKKIVFDEYHKTEKAPLVRLQTLVDAREGRKWGVHIAIASQLLADFDKDLIDIASGIWIMGVGNERSAVEAGAIFGLSPTALDIVRRELKGPTKEGAPFLVILGLKEGKHEHHLYNTLGPTELWAFSTTAEDAALRSRLYETMGPVEARKRLAARFSGGSAKSEIERRVAKMMARGARDDSEAQQGIIEDLVNELSRAPA
jgi:intracellular multiplication protein IcmB